MSVFIYEKDDDGIVTVTMDMTGPVNAVNAEYNVAMEETVSRLEVEDDLLGVIFASAKKVFFAGADLKELVLADSNDVEGLFAEGESFKSQLRRLEKLAVPVVAAINGAALGGGYELSLACNYRLAYNHKSVQIGLPECALGVYPAGGGVVRLTKLIGVESALDVILKSQRMNPEKALAAGLIHDIVDEMDDLLPRARAWIKDNLEIQDAAIQPWDRKGYRVPGGAINSPRNCLLYTSPSPRDMRRSRMPSSA